MLRGVSAGPVSAGLRLGRYQLLLAVASGGMGQVWAARLVGHMGFRRLVAVKTLLAHDEPAAGSERERMLLDEARIAALIQHPNVCSVYDLSEDEGVLFVAMEWVNGAGLNTLLRRAPNHKAPLALAARIVGLAAAGLHAAHELRCEDGEVLGVVHRDVSPHNVLVALDGHVKVVDFGIAKARGQFHAKTMTGEVKGKVHYMAPEQVSGGAVDRRADIFALGAVLYESTLGRVPFQGEALTVMYKLLEAEVTPPRALDPSYPEGLEKIVLKCLARDPGARFETADQLRAALDAWVSETGEVITDVEVSAWVRSLVGEELETRTRAIREVSESMEILTPVSSRTDLAATPTSSSRPRPASDDVTRRLPTSSPGDASGETSTFSSLTASPSGAARRLPKRAPLVFGIGALGLAISLALVTPWQMAPRHDDAPPLAAQSGSIPGPRAEAQHDVDPPRAITPAPSAKEVALAAVSAVPLASVRGAMLARKPAVVSRAPLPSALPVTVHDDRREITAPPAAAPTVPRRRELDSDNPF